LLGSLDRGTKIEHLGSSFVDSNQPWFLGFQRRLAVFNAFFVNAGSGMTYTLSCLAAMLNRQTLYSAFLLIVLLVAPFPAMSAAGDSTKNIVLTLPAETVLTSLQKMLPLDIPSQSRQLQGDITLESLDRLVIHNNVVTVRGVLSGKNLVVLTQLAGQDIQLKVGEVRLPMTCDLQIRFDPGQRKLFVTPRFTDSTQNPNNPQDSLTPLLGALGGREYLVDLDALQLINVRIGAKSIPIAMEPVNIAGTDNTLIFHLLPRVGVAR
jgi:hypothetical protein